MILVDVKSRTIFLVPSFRRFIFFHTKKLGGFWRFWLLLFFWLVPLKNTGIPRWIFGHRWLIRWSWAPCPWDHLTLVSLRMRFCPFRLRGVGVVAFRGFWMMSDRTCFRMMFLRGNMNLAKPWMMVFFLYTLKVGILFQTLRNRSIFFKTTRFLASHFLSLNFCAFWKGAFGWNIIFWAVLHDFCKGAMDGSHVFLLNDKLKGLQSSVWVVRTKQFWMVINFEVDLRDEVFVTETNPFRKDVPGLLTSETAQYLRGGFTHWFWDWTWMTRFCGACAPRSLFTEMPRKVQNQIKVRKVCVDLWGIKKWQIQNVMKRGVTFQSYVFCASLARRSRLTHHSLQFGFEKS